MKHILLHGLGQSAISWTDTVKNMEPIDDILCLNLSEWLPDGTACYTGLYDGLAKYCAQLEGPLNLCGLSLGGILALQYGIEHPDRVNSLVLIGTQYVMPKKLMKFQNALFHLMPKNAFSNMGFPKRSFIKLCNSMVHLDFTEGLGQLRCPVLIVCGEKDEANKTASVQMKEQIPNAELVMIPGAGHEVNRDAPAELGKAVSDFFIDNSRAAGGEQRHAFRG